ncbi:hypothetical protein [Brevibacterium sediminis]
MALIRLTLLTERRTPDTVSPEPRETLVNAQTIEWVTTVAKGDRIYLVIKTVGESGTGKYAAVNAIGNNTVREVSAEQVLRDFQTVVQVAEDRQ